MNENELQVFGVAWIALYLLCSKRAKTSFYHMAQNNSKCLCGQIMSLVKVYKISSNLNLYKFVLHCVILSD